MQPGYRSIALLLSLGSLPVACGKGDKDSEGDSTGTGSTGTTGTTDALTDPGGSTTSGATGMASTGEDTGATEPQPTTSTASMTSSASTDGPETGGYQGPGPICEAYGAHYAECFPRYARYGEMRADSCGFYSYYAEKMDGPACGDAYDAYFVCLTMTPCADLKNEPPDLPCEAESQAFLDACPSTDA